MQVMVDIVLLCFHGLSPSFSCSLLICAVTHVVSVTLVKGNILILFRLTKICKYRDISIPRKIFGTCMEIDLPDYVYTF